MITATAMVTVRMAGMATAIPRTAMATAIPRTATATAIPRTATGMATATGVTATATAAAGNCRFPGFHSRLGGCRSRPRDVMSVSGSLCYAGQFAGEASSRELEMD